MKKILLSVYAVTAMSSSVFAGGDNEPVAAIPVAVIPVVEETNGFYLGGAVAAAVGHDSDVAIKLFNGTDDASNDRLGNITLLAGYDFNDYIAVEGRYTMSVFDEDVTEMNGWSLFAKPQYHFDESNFSIYALLGLGGVTIDGKNGYFADVDDTGFQWGLGVAYSFGDYMEDNNLAVFVDYTSLASDMDGIFANGALQTDVDVFSLGVTYIF